MKSIEKYTEQDNQFYPTPKSFLRKISEDFRSEFKCFTEEHLYDIKVLEPSAGKGDIATHIREYGLNTSSYDPTPRCHVECVEIDKTLQATLKGLNLPIVGDDFLSYNSYTKYDLIYMNPPFADGDKHLLKAISVQERYGGRILCILNAETIKNPYSLSRKELKAKLDKYGAVIRFYDSPFCSFDSERISTVEVAVIWIDVPTIESGYNSKVFENLDKAEAIKIDTEESTEQNELIKMGLDWITAIVKQYDEQIRSGIAFFKEYNAFQSEYDKRFKETFSTSDRYYKTPIDVLVYGDTKNGLQEYIEITRYYYWLKLFDNPKFSGRLTSKLQSDLYSRIEEMKKYDFTERNILILMQENMNATVKGIEQAILDLFQTLTSNAQYDGCENIHYYNGWKTNSAYKINNKIIIPFYAFRKENCYSGSSFWNMRISGYEYRFERYDVINRLTEMSKVLNYLANGVCGLDSPENISQIIKLCDDYGDYKNIETEHFILTFYKKGTCHLKFRNQDLLDKFNLFASQRKGWLPPEYGKKAYGSMNKEEKELVKEFSGSIENYNKIYENQQKYIVENSQLLQING